MLQLSQSSISLGRGHLLQSFSLQTVCPRESLISYLAESLDGGLETSQLHLAGEMLVHLSSSGLLALVFSGSGEVAWRFWPEKHAIYKLHTGVYVGDTGGRLVSCHDGDAVLWNIQNNEACVHGLLQGHRANIVKVR